MPRVSVVMPMFNAERFLGAAIESVLAQSYPDFELIVVDDGSSDASRARAAAYRDPRLRLLANTRNLGQTASLNIALASASGELVARQDADDVSEPDRLARQVEHLDRHPEIIVLGAQGMQLDDRGRGYAPLVRPRSHEVIVWELLLDNPLLHTSVMFRRRPISEGLGGYDESFRYAQDRALWSRAARLGRLAALGLRLVGCRHHAGAMTTTLRERNLEENRRITPANVESFLGLRFSAEELDLLARFREGLPPASVEAFRLLHARLLAEFLRRHPDIAESPELRGSLAAQIGALLRTPGLSWTRRVALLWGAVAAGYPVWAWLMRAARARWARAG